MCLLHQKAEENGHSGDLSNCLTRWNFRSILSQPLSMQDSKAPGAIVGELLFLGASSYQATPHPHRVVRTLVRILSSVVPHKKPNLMFQQIRNYETPLRPLGFQPRLDAILLKAVPCPSSEGAYP